MADKPSRVLVLFGDGLASFLDADDAGRRNLDALASLASCGFLALRDTSPPPQDYEDHIATQDLAQLFDVYDLYSTNNDAQSKTNALADLKEPTLPKLSERFMGMKAAMVTNCAKVGSFSAQLGFNSVQINGLTSPLTSVGEKLQNDVVSQLLGLLGFSGGNVLDDSEYDLVFFHLKPEDTKTQKTATAYVHWFDSLVGEIVNSAQLSPVISSRLHLSVILSYRPVVNGKDNYSLVLHPSLDIESDLRLLRPVQSYMIRHGSLLENLRHHHPMLLAQLQHGVTRKDLAKAFTFEQFLQHGGNCAILADRFLHEVAFKLWKAPKYGA